MNTTTPNPETPQTYNVNLATVAAINWVSPPKDAAEETMRAQLDASIQAVATKLRPIFAQLVITILSDRVETQQVMAKMAGKPAESIAAAKPREVEVPNKKVVAAPTDENPFG